MVLGHAHGLAHPKSLVVCDSKLIVYIVKDAEKGHALWKVGAVNLFTKRRELFDDESLRIRAIKVDLAVVNGQPRDLIAFYKCADVIYQHAQAFRIFEIAKLVQDGHEVAHNVRRMR